MCVYLFVCVYPHVRTIWTRERLIFLSSDVLSLWAHICDCRPARAHASLKTCSMKWFGRVYFGSRETSSVIIGCVATYYSKWEKAKKESGENITEGVISGGFVHILYGLCWQKPPYLLIFVKQLLYMKRDNWKRVASVAGRDNSCKTLKRQGLCLMSSLASKGRFSVWVHILC